MAIKFICSCGKHLRARDEMAARRSMCPRCGAPVGIPSLHPTHGGTRATPMTPQERLRHNRSRVTNRAASTNEPGTPTLPQGRGSVSPPAAKQPVRRLRRLRNLESHWYQCLLYPFLVYRLLFALSLALTACSAAVVFLIPKMIPLSEASLPARERLAFWPSLLLPIVLVAYTCASLECALTSALAGQGSAAYAPGRNLALIFRLGLRWFVCWLAGPAWLMALAAYFWFYSGDPEPIDWLILAELGVFAVSYWLLSIVAANESGRLRDATPLRVVQLLQRLKHRAVVPVLLAPALLVAHGFLLVFSLTELHKNGVFLALLWACWLSALFWGLFLFRLLGVWCYRYPGAVVARPTEPRP